jgi:hypothetical protein
MLKTVQTGANFAATSRSVVYPAGPITLSAALYTDVVCIVQGAYPITLPSAVGNTNRYSVENAHSANITVSTTSSQTINGSLTALMIPNQALEFISDGANWRIF